MLVIYCYLLGRSFAAERVPACPFAVDMAEVDQEWVLREVAADGNDSENGH